MTTHAPLVIDIAGTALTALDRKRLRLDHFIKAFFGSNALLSIVVLGLITLFLFREPSLAPTPIQNYIHNLQKHFLPCSLRQ